MNTLRKVFFTILALVILSVLKHLLDRYSPASIVFHYNFLTCIQYFLLIGVLLWTLLKWLYKLIVKRPLKTITFWIIFLGILTTSEIFFYYALRHSEKTSGRFHNILTEYYMEYEINFPQLEYDPVLSYTLKKNSVYVHSNIEFSNEIRTNSMGLRDDSASLIKPEIICLGDSYTMGWGVEQDKSFPQLIEHTTGHRVLNTGITSYGTARELLMLNRLDTSAVKYLVIQYCYNDWTENQTFLKNNAYLPIGSQKTQNNTFKSYQLARTYFPFKYTLTMLRMYLRNTFFKRMQTKTPEALPWESSLDYVGPSAKAFVQILSGSRINLSKLKVFVIDTNRYPEYDHHFLDSVESIISKGSFNAGFKKNVHIIKFPELNNQQYFYPLDNHLNEKGHALVADKLISALKQNP